MFGDALSLALRPFVWAFGVASELLYNAGALPVFFAMFAASVVVRAFVRPIVGEARSEFSSEVKKTGKENYKKLRGGE